MIMYDTIHPDQFAGLVMDAAAGYVDGMWPTFATLGRYVPPGTQLMSISVFGNAADCIDVEPGNVDNGQGAAWARARIDAGHWRPVVYTAASNTAAMLAALTAVGVGREQIRLWSAHYGAGEHVCGPPSCGYPAADGTQWTDQAHGRNLDQSLIPAWWFNPPPPPPPAKQTGDEPMQVVFGADNAAGIPVPRNVTHFRLAWSQGGKVSILWPKSGIAAKVVTIAPNSYYDEPIQATPPEGCVRLDYVSGNGPVYFAWLFA